MQGRVMEEKITKTDDAVDVNMPNSMEIVYDYTHVSLHHIPSNMFIARFKKSMFIIFKFKSLTY